MEQNSNNGGILPSAIKSEARSLTRGELALALIPYT
jgi:hypothetical protein